VKLCISRVDSATARNSLENPSPEHLAVVLDVRNVSKSLSLQSIFQFWKKIKIAKGEVRRIRWMIHSVMDLLARNSETCRTTIMVENPFVRPEFM
jgi:hypothetical protein